MMRFNPGRWLIGLTTLIGAGMLLYPFVLSAAGPNANHAADAPVLMLLLIPLLLGVLLADLATSAINARVVAALGILTAINAVLRLPAGPGDSPAFFFLVILTGYVYGGRMGFLLGALSLFVSAFLVAGFGPWMPYQMLAMGWMGLGAGALPGLGLRLGLRAGGWGEIGLLALYGWVWGFLFGAIMNLTFWPFAFSEAAISWEPGLGLAETLRRYRSFYILTSLAWDAVRGLFNGLLLLAFGRPLLRVLRRFGLRLRWEPLSAASATTAPPPAAPAPAPR